LAWHGACHWTQRQVRHGSMNTCVYVRERHSIASSIKSHGSWNVFCAYLCWCNAGAFSSERVVASTPALTTIDNSPIYAPCALAPSWDLAFGFRAHFISPRSPLVCPQCTKHNAQSTQCALRRPHTGHERRDSRERQRAHGARVFGLYFALRFVRDAGCGKVRGERGRGAWGRRNCAPARVSRRAACR
jgi:hypothetical protein